MRDQEGADLVEIAQRREAVALRARAQRKLHHDVVDPRAQALVERRGDAHQHARADDVEHALEGEQRQRQHRERDQRRHAPAREHAVVDLQHVERAGEVENVDEAAHQADGDEGVPARRQRLAQLGRRRRAGRRTGSAHHRHWVPISPRPCRRASFEPGHGPRPRFLTRSYYALAASQAQPLQRARERNPALPHLTYRWSRPRANQFNCVPKYYNTAGVPPLPANGIFRVARAGGRFPRWRFRRGARSGARFRDREGTRRDKCFGRRDRHPARGRSRRNLDAHRHALRELREVPVPEPGGGACRRAAPRARARRR